MSATWSRCDVEVALHALGVREGRRRAEDQVVAVALLGEERRHVAAHERVRRAGTRLSVEVLAGPVEVGVRQVDAHRRAARRRPRRRPSPSRCTRTGSGSVLPRGQRWIMRAHAAVIEEQPGVEVVAQVDEEPVAALAHRRASCRARPLRTASPCAALAAALLDVARRRRRCRARSGTSARMSPSRSSARAGSIVAGGAYSCTCAGVLVEVDGDGVLDEIGVVDAIAVDVFALRPLPAVLEVLAQAIGERLGAHGRARAQRALGRRRRAIGSSSRRHSIGPLKSTWRRAGAQADALLQLGVRRSGRRRRQPVKRWRSTLPICS